MGPDKSRHRRVESGTNDAPEALKLLGRVSNPDNPARLPHLHPPHSIVPSTARSMNRILCAYGSTNISITSKRHAPMADDVFSTGKHAPAIRRALSLTARNRVAN